jgi:hypothetical protein
MIALDRLQQIIPSDQALANKALATSLQQVAGISNLTLPEFARAVGAIQTTRDLPAITALTTPVPASVADYFTSTLNVNGTGVNNTILIMDILGTAAGYNLTDSLVNTVEIFSGMNLSTLAGIYTIMQAVVDGTYGDPVTGPVVIPSGPYAGSYADANAAFSSTLIPAAQSEIATLASTYAAQVTELNADWTTMAQQSNREISLQASASLNFDNLTANQQSSIYGFIYSLPGYALNTEVGGTTQLIEAIADLDTFTGQAIIACFRQERNQAVLSASGIQTTNQIPSESDPLPPQATLIPSEYSESEAANLVIK